MHTCLKQSHRWDSVIMGVGASLLLLLQSSVFAAEIVWTNLNGGNWNTAANWSPNTVPNSADHIAIITNAGTYAVTNNATRTIGGLVVGGPSGTQTLAQLSAYNLTLQGTGSIGPNGRLHWAAGSLYGTNVITLEGQMQWLGGTLGYNASGGNTVVMVTTNGRLNLSGTSTKWLYSALTNDGVIAWADSGSFNQYGILHNRPNGLVDAQTNATMNASGSPLLVNEGTIRKSGGTGITSLEPVLVNSGTLDAQTGTLQLANLSKNLLSGSRLTGAGTNQLVALAGGQLCTLAGSLYSENLVLSSGSLSGHATIGGSLIWSYGTILSNASLTLSSGSTLRLDGSNAKTVRGAITNAGHIIWEGTGDIDCYGTLYNAPSGVFEARNDRYLDYVSGSPVFINDGTFRKTTATGITTCQIAFINNGTVDVQSGTLQMTQETKTFNAGCHFTGAGQVSLGTGTILLNGGFSSENLVLDGAALSGSGTLSGTMTWSYGSIALGGALTVGAAGVLQASGANAKTLQGALTNAGSVIWAGTDNFDFHANSVIHNLAGGVFEARNNQYLDFISGPCLFINDGIFRKSLGTGVTMIQVAFVNNGTVDAQTGTIQFTQEAKTLNAGCRFTGAGVSALAGGTVNLSGNIESENLVLAGATLSGAGSINGSFTWNSGTLSPDVSFNVTPTGHLALASSSAKIINGTITNAGVVTWTGTGNLQVRGAIHNKAGGLFEIQNNEYLDWLSGTPVFVNDGIVRKTVATGTTVCQISFINNGTVDIQTGVFQLTQEPKTLNAGCRFTGAGRTTLTYGTISLNGAIESENLSLDGASLTGAGSVNGSFIWNTGTLTPDISFNVTPAGLLLLASSGNKTLNGTITNAGTVRWTGTGNLRVTGAIHNLPGGLFEMQNNEVLDFLSGTPVFVNEGTFRKSVGTGTTTCQIPFHNFGQVEVNAGTLYFTGSFADHAGTLALGGGVMQTVHPLALAGTLSGRGTLRPYTGSTAALTSAGIIAPASNGVLRIEGSLTQLLPGTLQLTLAGTAPGTNHSRLHVTGDAAFKGTIGVSLAPGYLPSPGDTFDVVRFASTTGDFQCFNGFLFLGQNRRLLTQFSATNLSLVTVTMPDPTNPPVRLTAEGAMSLYCWPAEFTGWQLLASTNVAATNWPVVPGVTNRYLEAPMVREKFFRLRKP